LDSKLRESLNSCITILNAAGAGFEMSRLSAKVAQSQEDVEDEDVAEVVDDDYEESDVEFNMESEPVKDETEEELEQLVFGDRAGFRERLKSFPQQNTLEGAAEQEGTGLEGLDDAEVGQALDVEYKKSG
jgi:hypothetical protein